MRFWIFFSKFPAFPLKLGVDGKGPTAINLQGYKIRHEFTFIFAIVVFVMQCVISMFILLYTVVIHVPKVKWPVFPNFKCQIFFTFFSLLIFFFFFNHSRPLTETSCRNTAGGKREGIHESNPIVALVVIFRIHCADPCLMYVDSGLGSGKAWGSTGIDMNPGPWSDLCTHPFSTSPYEQCVVQKRSAPQPG